MKIQFSYETFFIYRFEKSGADVPVNFDGSSDNLPCKFSVLVFRLHWRLLSIVFTTEFMDIIPRTLCVLRVLSG